MHPPFIFPNHPVGPNRSSPTPERKQVHRSEPETLQITPAATGWPPVPLIEPTDQYPAPASEAVAAGDRLQIVPPPRNTVKDRIGRWLIRLGQRMILENNPG